MILAGRVPECVSSEVERDGKIKAYLAPGPRGCLHIGNHGDGEAVGAWNGRFRAGRVSRAVSRSGVSAAVAVETPVSRGATRSSPAFRPRIRSMRTKRPLF